MHIETVSIGNEFLCGEILDSNASFLNAQLSCQGYRVQRHTVLPDDSEALFQGLKEALNRSTFVICTGGLGSTFDDVTKKVAARLFWSSFQIDLAWFDELRRRFGDSPTLRESARLPKDAIILPNPIGTAPGIVFLSTEGSLILLPGVFCEMKAIFLNSVLPLLQNHFPQVKKMQMKRLHFCHLSETMVSPILQEIALKNPDAKINVYPSLSGVEVVFSVLQNVERLQEWEKKLLHAFPTYFFDAPTIHEAVHHALIEKRETLALAESCTGGALALRFVSLTGASNYLLGSIVAYSNEWKEQFLGVSHETIMQYGAVSVHTVKEMVQGILQKSKAKYAIAVSGLAGPSKGSETVSVGTIFIAVAEKNGWMDAGEIRAPLDRLSAIEFSVQYALGMLWRHITYQARTFA